MGKYKFIKYIDIDFAERKAIIQNIVSRKCYNVSFIKFKMDKKYFIKYEEVDRCYSRLSLNNDYDKFWNKVYNYAEHHLK